MVLTDGPWPLPRNAWSCKTMRPAISAIAAARTKAATTRLRSSGRATGRREWFFPRLVSSGGLMPSLNHEPMAGVGNPAGETVAMRRDPRTVRCGPRGSLRQARGACSGWRQNSRSTGRSKGLQPHPDRPLGIASARGVTGPASTRHCRLASSHEAVLALARRAPKASRGLPSRHQRLRRSGSPAHDSPALRRSGGIIVGQGMVPHRRKLDMDDVVYPVLT